MTAVGRVDVLWDISAAVGRMHQSAFAPKPPFARKQYSCLTVRSIRDHYTLPDGSCVSVVVEQIDFLTYVVPDGLVLLEESVTDYQKIF